MIERISPPGVPVPQGPYSPAVRAGDFIFVAGQGPIDPATGEFSLGSIEHETGIVLENIRRILEGCGAGMTDVVHWFPVCAAMTGTRNFIALGADMGRVAQR